MIIKNIFASVFVLLRIALSCATRSEVILTVCHATQSNTKTTVRVNRPSPAYVTQHCVLHLCVLRDIA
jgi:hypothetical protein